MKRVISILLTLVMCFTLLSLASCGGSTAGQTGTYTEDETEGQIVEDGGNDGPGENGEGGTENGNSSNGNGGGSGSGKKVDKDEEQIFLNVPGELKGTTVKFATWIDHKSCDYSHVFSDFSNLTGINVEIVPVTQSDYIVKLSGMKAAGTAPDVIVENEGNFPRTLTLLQPITEATTGINVKDAFWDQNITKLYTINGKCYAVNGNNSSWQMASPLVYYNIPLLKKYGIKNPNSYIKENNWTLETFFKCMSDCRTAGIATGGEIDLTVYSHIYGGGPYHYDAATAKYSNTMNTQRFKNMWAQLTTYSEKGVVKLTNQWASSLTSGTTGLVFTGAYGLRKQPGWFYQMDSDDIGYAYPPKENASDANYPTSTMTRAYCIAAGAKNPKGAGYFLRYFLNDDWYGDDEIFKDNRAKEMHYALQKIKNFSSPILDGVIKTQYDDYKAFYNELATSTPAQVNTNIEKVSQKMDYCIKKANALIDAAR